MGGKFTSIAIRVPVITGSLIDLSIVVEKKPASIEEINKVFKDQSENKYKHYIEYSEAELVSSDIIGNIHSSIFDSRLTTMHDDMIRIFAWYDNESGYSARLADLARRV